MDENQKEKIKVILEIKEGYRCVLDTYQIVLQEKSKTKEDEYLAIGYFKTWIGIFEFLVNKLAKDKAKKKKTKLFDEYLQILKEERKYLEKMFKNVNFPIKLEE